VAGLPIPTPFLHLSLTPEVAQRPDAARGDLAPEDAHSANDRPLPVARQFPLVSNALE